MKAELEGGRKTGFSQYCKGSQIMLDHRWLLLIGVKNKAEAVYTGYYIGKDCIGCKLCYSVCPQKCIDISSVPVVINQNHCLHCGRCAEICPKQCIVKRG